MKKIVIFVLFVAVCCGKMFAQQPGVVISDKAGWHKIGETIVGFKAEKDEIMVMGADRFQSIKIKVMDAPVHIESFVIHFVSGDVQNVTISKEIKSAGETKVVPLNGGERSIKKVVFIYKTTPNNMDRKARIELWGLKTNSDKNTTTTK
jgi:hypothetical protein